MTMIACHECGTSIQRKHGKHSRCFRCSIVVNQVAGRTRNAVKRAIRQGLLADLKATIVPCADCGAVAKHYDHRDYAKPLEVEAVCHSCNLRRGPAAPVGVAA